jgi:hypothetical protein
MSTPGERDEQPGPEREVLVVTDTAIAASSLACVVGDRAKAGGRRFTLLIPAVAHGLSQVVDPEDQCCAVAEQTARALRPLLEAAAGGPLTIVIGSHDPMAAVQDALNAEDSGEVILAVRSSRPARWARVDLASKVKALGVPMTAIPVSPEPLEAA